MAGPADCMIRTRLKVPRMDCAAEERLVRMGCAGDPRIHRVDINLAERQVSAVHEDDCTNLLELLGPLGAGAHVLDSAVWSKTDEAANEPTRPGEVNALRIAFAINGAMFLGESIGGVVADSSALIADSLDMFADAAVYGIALYGAGRALEGQRKAARLSGWMQLALAGGAAFEVARRALAGSEPESTLMMGVALVALLANATTMWLLAGHRRGGAHMKASWIFTTNDVLANIGVIVGGALVGITGTRIPDLVVGGVIALVVFTGAVRILRLASAHAVV